MGIYRVECGFMGPYTISLNNALFQVWLFDYHHIYTKNLGRLWLAYTELQVDFTC